MTSCAIIYAKVADTTRVPAITQDKVFCSNANAKKRADKAINNNLHLESVKLFLLNNYITLLVW
jgi:hypothetical protein